MTRRLFLTLTLVCTLFGSVRAQNIPPTYVPQTEEPGRADPKTAGDQPRALQGPTPGGNIAGLVAAPPGTPDPPTPIVTIHVSAPASASAGADVEYKIVVENKSQAAAHHVRVTNPIPEGVQVIDEKIQPLADETTPKLRGWKLGTLKPGENRTIRITLRPTREGLDALENTARVHFEHGQKVRTILHRPMLVVRKVTHQHALENQAIACKLIVENTGAVDVVNIDINDVLGDGLVIDDNGQSKGPLKNWKIASLGPKQKQEFVYSVKATRQGVLTSKIEARAERGATANYDWQINVGPSPLRVTMTGPPKVYLNYPATYQIQVHYAGTTPLDNVMVAFSLPKGMKVMRATPGSQDFKDRLQWAIQRLNPRETRTYSVSVQTASPGTVPQFAQVLWRGPEQKAEVTTEFLGAVALQLDVRESNDPVRVGDKVRYQISVTNKGSAAARDVKLYVRFPQTQFALSVDESDGRAGAEMVQEIVLNEVGPKQTVMKQITLKATGAGKAIVHVEMASTELPAGNVTREEPTTITD